MEEEVEAAKKKFEKHDNEYLLAEAARISDSIGEVSKDFSKLPPETRKQVIDYCAIRFLLRSRSQENREFWIFNKKQAAIIVFLPKSWLSVHLAD